MKNASERSGGLKKIAKGEKTSAEFEGRFQTGVGGGYRQEKKSRKARYEAGSCCWRQMRRDELNAVEMKIL